MTATERLFEILVQRRLMAGFVIGCVTLSIGIGIRLALGDVFLGFPFVTFYPAVLITAFVGGWRPACATGVAASLFSWYFLIPPRYSFQLTTSSAIGLFGDTLVVAIEIALIEIIGIAARRLHAKQLRADALLAERDAMFLELQHRVANNMQFVASLLTLQSRAIPKGDPGQAALRQAVDRLVLFGTVHRKLHNPQLAQGGFADLVKDVLNDLLRATDNAHVALTVSADKLTLPLGTITTLVLITTEAATNSIKHVFGKAKGTRLDVTLRGRADGQIHLTITDDGPGFPAEASQSAALGQGLRILQALAAQIGGTLVLKASAGSIVHVRFPSTSASPGQADLAPSVRSAPRDNGMRQASGMAGIS